MTFGLSKSRSFDEVWRDVHRDVPLECIQACMRCELACLASAEACLGDADLQDLGRCVRLSLDCAEICLATRTLVAEALLSAPRLVLAQLLVCARMCATCEAECGRLGPHSTQIGRAARACADCLTLCFETTRHVQNLH
jgi:hypothetical protein